MLVALADRLLLADPESSALGDSGTLALSPTESVPVILLMLGCN